MLKPTLLLEAYHTQVVAHVECKTMMTRLGWQVQMRGGDAENLCELVHVHAS